MEHDMSDAQMADFAELGHAVEASVTSGYQKIENAVVGGYKKMESAVVDGYKKMEEGVVEGFEKMTNKFVEKLFVREGETVEEARKRLNGDKSEAE